MDRATFLAERCQRLEERYDTLHAAGYDEQWGEIDVSHRAFLTRFLTLCPPGGTILDAACGTGKYWPLILDSGRSVVGIDQSQQMLARATAKFPRVRTEKRGLHEIDAVAAFDGIICVDALEFIAPEDWPHVLSRFQRALTPGGHLYITVELCDPAERMEAYQEGLKQGLPVVEGEYAHTGSYHYYPSLEQVRLWLSQVAFTVLDEAEGDYYQHLLVRKA